MSKYSARLGKKKPKERDICYASHIDRCIFQYYSFLLNELYNRRILDDGIFEVPIAYRSDLHKTNIYFSKKAFDFIMEARENELSSIIEESESKKRIYYIYS